MATQPDNPHDRFFKETFSQPEVLIDFLNAFAPEDVRERLDYATLTREVDTFTRYLSIMAIDAGNSAMCPIISRP